MDRRGRKQRSCLSLAAVLFAAILTAPGSTFFSVGEAKGAQVETRTGSSRTSSARRGVINYGGQWEMLLGKKVKGVVAKVNPLSADVDLGAGVMANFNVREFAADRIEKGEDVFHVGQEVVARLSRFTRRRFELTRVDDPKAPLPVGGEVRGTVTKLNQWSADVDIDGSEVLGNFHVAEFTTQRVEKAEDVFHVGQEVVARVTRFTGRRFELTRVDDPMITLPIGGEVRGTVTQVNQWSADIDIDGSEVLGNFHVGEFTNERVEKAEDVFHVGQEVTARVMAIRRGKRARYELARVDHPFFAIVED
eukprot:TRINITY_DN11357_c0_g2_i1.p1 TRINITY_DN11357_c0_g2~~TRINITY_DN11357_c0_g2_i1.p1  ORF type:complete len:306 (+),score=51.55 TRINITY_DN11357_c0_g2_i1:37-954(+)